MNGQSLNRFAYVNGNPVGMVDPLGLCGENAGGSAGASQGWFDQFLTNTKRGYNAMQGPNAQANINLIKKFGSNTDFAIAAGSDFVVNVLPWFIPGGGGTKVGEEAIVGTTKAADEIINVSRWGRSGLEAGDWVMKGKDTWLNYIKTFKWQPGMGNEFASKATGEVFQVPKGTVKWPTGWGVDGWVKGLFGQRRYIP